MKDLVNREAAPSPPHLPFSCRSPTGTFLAADTHDLPTDLSQGAGSGRAPWPFVSNLDTRSVSKLLSNPPPMSLEGPGGSTLTSKSNEGYFPCLLSGLCPLPAAFHLGQQGAKGPRQDRRSPPNLAPRSALPSPGCLSKGVSSLSPPLKNGLTIVPTSEVHR